MNRLFHRAFLGSAVTLAAIVGCDDRQRTTRTTDPDPNGVVDPVVPRTDPLATPRDDLDAPRQPGDRDATAQPKQPARDPAPADSSDKSAASQPNREALGYLIVINRNETDAVNAALKKELSQPVQDFAKKIQADHIKNFDETMNLGQKISGLPMQNEEATQMRSKHEAKLKEMTQLTGQEFEREFVNAMVKSHTEALTTLDKALQNADNAAVKAHLQGTRQKISEHLEQARQLQQQLGGQDAEAQPLDQNKTDEQK